MNKFLIAGVILLLSNGSIASANQGSWHLQVHAQPTDEKMLGQVIVALVPKQSLPQHQAPATIRISQTNAQFEPFISVAQTGARIEFPNNDSFAHHVYSFSKALSFDVPLYNDSKVPFIQAERSGIVAFGCNIHDWMLGYLLIVDTPFYGRLHQGRIDFDAVPFGDYEIALWHPSMPDFYVNKTQVSSASQQVALHLPTGLKIAKRLPTPAFTDTDAY